MKDFVNLMFELIKSSWIFLSLMFESDGYS